MLKKIITAAAAALCMVTFGAFTVYSLDCTCRGYGQGREVDEKNRPTGAEMFNNEYGQYDCYAMFDDDKSICLTFDQGYENGYTAPILDTLKDKNVKAVFFLTGDYAERNPELVRRMIDEGHIIGNHGWKHASLPKLSETEAENEIMTLHEYVKDKFGYEMCYFRPPCGEYSEQALAACQRLGYKTLLWSFAYEDWDVNKQPSTDAAFERVSTAAHGGAIYLLHSVSATNAEILGRVIDSIREQGFELSLPTT
ncbi:MAG: polysaccharide deacetylase family protein [Oscillospiraceae bacterium]|nr:polysaccharide deacetylase family protein [Oscillospiraceae bacterium]